MKKTYFAALVLAVLGALALWLHHTVIPLSQTSPLSEMSREPDGLYATELSPTWPLRINKQALDQLTVKVAGGADLPRVAARSSLSEPGAQAGFYLRRLELLVGLGAAAPERADLALEITTPIKLSENIYIALFSLAGLLLAVAHLRDGTAALVRGKTKAMVFALAASLLSALAGLGLLLTAQAFAIWLGLGLVACGFLGGLVAILRAGELAMGKRSRSREFAASAALVVASTALCMVAIEVYLGFASERVAEERPIDSSSDTDIRQDWFELPDDVVASAAARARAITLPKDWERRPAEVANATSAYHWHSALHVHDKHGFRRVNEPFPAKDSGTLRVMVVGDSLTYGYGIEEKWTFSGLLQSRLVKSYEAEVINLGRSGYQSTDILYVTETFAPQISPDLVIYAVCLNDFLPSGQNQGSGASFPIPESWKEYLLERTRLASLVSDGYHNLLLAADLKKDFYDDILSQDSDYKERFAADVRGINRFAAENGLPPVIGIVFQQYFGGDERAWALIETAEESLEAAGFDLISIRSWRQELEGKNFPVSRWEGHPNELAHSLLAEALYERILARDYADGYRRDKSRSKKEQGDNTD